MHFTTLILVSPSKLFPPLLLHFLYPVSCIKHRGAQTSGKAREITGRAAVPRCCNKDDDGELGCDLRERNSVCRVVRRRRHSRPRSSQGTDAALAKEGFGKSPRKGPSRRRRPRLTRRRRGSPS